MQEYLLDRFGIILFRLDTALFLNTIGGFHFIYQLTLDPRLYGMFDWTIGNKLIRCQIATECCY